MKALLVIDMQENYLGKKAKSHYDAEGLIQNINRRIAECQENKELIIYIVNRFFYQRKAFRPQLAEGLTAASELLFEKQHADCFPIRIWCGFWRKIQLMKLRWSV